LKLKDDAGKAGAPARDFRVSFSGDLLGKCDGTGTFVPSPRSDVSNEVSVAAIAKEVQARFGRVDIW